MPIGRYHAPPEARRHRSSPALGPAAILILITGWAPGTSLAETLSWRLQVESGSEYDSNSHRRYSNDDNFDADPSPLARARARLQLGWKPADSHRVNLWTLAGATFYGAEDARTENALLSAADLRYRWLLPARQLTLSARVSHHDMFAYSYDYTDANDCATAVNIPRFFTSNIGELAMTIRGPDDHSLTLTGGAQRFLYKACSQFDWTGERYGLRYQTTTWRGDPDEDLDAASIDLRVEYELQNRAYSGELLVNNCPPGTELESTCLGTVGMARADLYHAISAEVIYTGDRIYSARYELGITDSNSFARSLIRQRIELGVTTELFYKIFLSAKAAVQLDIYPDSLIVAPDQVTGIEDPTIDEENRNSLSVHLSRDLGDTWTLEGRYALYSNEFAGIGQDYQRQVVYLGAIYRYQP